MKLIIGMTGATGATIGIRLLQVLGKMDDVQTHLIISKWAQQTILHETDFALGDVQALADVTYAANDIGAAISSGSYLTDGMVIVPCSMRSLAAVASGQGENLIQRAADVILKEGRKLVMVPRETPLSAIHLENMLKLARLGVVMLPPMPAFYSLPKSVDELIDHIVARILDQFGLPSDSIRRWGEDIAMGGQ